MRFKHYICESKSIHQIKKEFKTTAEDFIKKLARVYKIKNPYTIKIHSKIHYSGECDKDDQTISIKTSAMDTDTLYHEIAHWIQMERDGIKSFCTDMANFKNYDPDVAQEHYKMQKSVRKIAKDMGFDKKLREIIAS